MNPSAGIKWGLTALAFLLPLSIAGQNMAAALLTLCVLLLPTTGRPTEWRAAALPATAALLAYLGVAVLSSAAGVDPARSFSLLHKDLHKLWLLVVLPVAFAHAGRPPVGRALVAGGAAAAAVGLYQALTPDQLGRWWVRAHGFVHPVVYGELLSLLWLGVLCLLAAPSEGWRRGSRWLKAALGLLTGALIFNQTRGAFLAIAAGIAAVAPLHPKLRKWSGRLLLSAAVVVVIWELIPNNRSLIGGLLRYGLAPISNQQFDRLILWRVAGEMFHDHPWLGVGPHNYRTVFTQYFQGVIQEQSVWSSAHNLYLHQLAERGVIGLLALLWLLASLTRRALARARARPDAVNLWALAATVGFLVMNLTEVAFQSEQVAALFLLVWCWSESSFHSSRA